VIYVDEKLVTHPKIFRAGARLGPNGAAQALALFIAGLTYAREHLTDGFVPRDFVRSCGLVTTPQSVAQALTSRSVRLWHRTPGGYQIHDYHRWNKKASEIKEKREQERLKKAAQRAARNGGVDRMSRHVSPGDNSRTSRARASTIHVPLNTKSTSTDAPRRLAFARGKNARPEPATFALACVVMTEALELAHTVDSDVTVSTAGEHFKTLCAQRGLAYDGDLVRRAYDAVLVAHVRRRA
jgi:hypothetical protein